MEHTLCHRAAYDEARSRGLEATRLGRLQEAKQHFAEAAGHAERLDEQTQDRAFCNVALIAIELGEPVGTFVPRLRDVLVKNLDDENSRLAAYHLARTYDLRKDTKKAIFYARIALERSQRTGNGHWIASSYNQMGSLMIAESRFEEAQGLLGEALALMPETEAVKRALILDNLGYCHLIRGDHREGFRHLFRGLRALRRLSAEGWYHQFHLTFCFGYLEIGRWRRASVHGLRALDLSRRLGDSCAIKNALFLLGEAANLAGRPDQAHAFFRDLQQQYYPDQNFLPDFLLAVDVRGLVNLKA